MTSVQDRCRAIATFRHVSVALMETIARWTPLIAEMEAKVMFGRHIWDFAQHADALGKRTFELRQPEHYTLRPAGSYDSLLSDLKETEGTSERVAAIYEAILPGLTERYRRYLSETDSILDQPSVVILERIVRDLERMRSEAAALQRTLNLTEGAAALAARERSIPSMVAQRV
ncbi:MAG TPA: hypothetical protein VM534_10470 [Thermoanaerobaculia bacterium]|nr:hypothetical protein [Thermoanaerobaculia bacterium]